MISMTNWIYIIKVLLKSNLTRNKIRTMLLDRCLFSKKKINGCYQVNPQSVWDEILMHDENCIAQLKTLKIEDVFRVMSLYEEVEYKKMRGTYPRNMHKKGA